MMPLQSSVAFQRSTVSIRVSRAVCTPLCAKQKGNSANVKTNKRGKVSSRPGPGSKVFEQAQQQLQQSQGITPAEVRTTQQPPQQQQPQQQAQAASSSTQEIGRSPIAETPQVVVDRMFKRVLTFAGAPVVLGMVLFPVFWYLKVVQKVEYPLWIVYVTQALMFGGGLLGITYGILSTSWDPRREGTAVGWQELQANLPVLLNRNKQQ